MTDESIVGPAIDDSIIPEEFTDEEWAFFSGWRTVTSERSREARLRRLARENDKSFHKARRPFDQWGVRAKYYVSDMTDTLVAVYATLDAAEEDFQA